MFVGKALSGEGPSVSVPNKLKVLQTYVKIKKDFFTGDEIVQTGNNFYPKAFKIVDLYGLDCDMKAEFNSDNKRLYQKKRMLAKGNSKGFT